MHSIIEMVWMQVQYINLFQSLQTPIYVAGYHSYRMRLYIRRVCMRTRLHVVLQLSQPYNISICAHMRMRLVGGDGFILAQ